jgi:hypothetical protein
MFGLRGTKLKVIHAPGVNNPERLEIRQRRRHQKMVEHLNRSVRPRNRNQNRHRWKRSFWTTSGMNPSMNSRNMETRVQKTMLERKKTGLTMITVAAARLMTGIPQHRFHQLHASERRRRLQGRRNVQLGESRGRADRRRSDGLGGRWIACRCRIVCVDDCCRP